MNRDDRAYADAVEARLAASLVAGAQRGSGRLLTAARRLCLAGGKRIRPALVRSFGELLAVEGERLVDVAVAAEMMHAASLLHDDVVDHGQMRRGRPTANALEGNTVAVLAGDLLLATALELLSSHPDVAADAVSVVRRMTCAAILEVEARGDVDLDPDAWRAIAQDKTGALFAFCGRAVAALAPDVAAKGLFSSCGLHLGIAFQLGDDLRDLLPDDTGKDRFADLRNRSPSYPVLLAFREAPELRERARALYRLDAADPRTVSELGEAVLRTGALEGTRARIAAEVRAAREALSGFQPEIDTDDVFDWAARFFRTPTRPEVLACAAF